MGRAGQKLTAMVDSVFSTIRAAISLREPLVLTVANVNGRMELRCRKGEDAHAALIAIEESEADGAEVWDRQRREARERDRPPFDPPEDSEDLW